MELWMRKFNTNRKVLVNIWVFYFYLKKNWSSYMAMLILDVVHAYWLMMSVTHNKLECQFWNMFGLPVFPRLLKMVAHVTWSSHMQWTFASYITLLGCATIDTMNFASTIAHLRWATFAKWIVLNLSIGHSTRANMQVGFQFDSPKLVTYVIFWSSLANLLGEPSLLATRLNVWEHDLTISTRAPHIERDQP